MKATELRIGNTVAHKTWDDTDFKVKAIYEDRVYLENEDGYMSDFDLENTMPIPITEEWLLKFGFGKTYAKNCYGIKFHQYSCHTLYITIGQDANVVTIGDSYTREEHLTVFTGDIAEYVHSIQNLFFSLTGEELTPKPNSVGREG